MELDEATAAMAAEELAKLENQLSQYERRLELGPTLGCRSYGDLCSAIAQTAQRVEQQRARVTEFRAKLENAKAVASAAHQREVAQRAYDDALARLNTARAEVASKRQTLAQIQSELPMAEQRASLLLYEIDRAKTALKQMEVSA